TAVGRQVDLFSDVRAVELQRVLARLAFDGVVAVTGVPGEGVVARSQERHVVALAANDDVIAVAAKQEVVAVAAGNGIVARSAVDRHGDQRGQPVAGRHGVVAPTGVDYEVLGRADVQGERGRGRTIKPYPRAVGRDGENLGAIAAVDFDRVVAVAALVDVAVVARVPD